MMQDFWKMLKIESIAILLGNSERRRDSWLAAQCGRPTAG
jgi:hypothetical protein